ncbi:MAG: prepilin-type N-terminal cleavage/methylation domain-containing protein [Desulfobacterales bacterium]|nr:prepilin-type N-terminal cleavage/methylation domain-containing protein [Desulfobacterales bacterium]
MNWVGIKIDQGPVKSPSIPLYKRGKILKWFQQVPPFHKGENPPSPPFSKGGPGGILQEEGYTLVEILIAIAILAFGLLAVATMQVTAIKTNAIASGISQGLTLGQTKVEELMNLAYSALNDTDLDGTDEDADDDGIDDDGGNFGLNDTGNDSDNEEPNGRYTIYWNVAVNEPVISSKTIRVIVTWTEKGRNKRIKLDFVKTSLS